MKMRERYLRGEADVVVVRTYSRFTRVIADYFVLTQEMRDFVAWCQEFKRSGGDASYQRKREALRFLGVSVYIYKRSSPEGQYKIRLAPPELMRSLKLLPKHIAGTSSRSGS
jgi:hypothetical protein